MMSFLGFIALAVMYAVGMVVLGRYLRARGHGSELDRFGAIYERAQARAKAATLRRLVRRKRRPASSEDFSE